MQGIDIFEAYQNGMRAIIRFLGLIGEWIVNYPNGIFYLLIVLGCLFIPFLSLILVISFLCWSWSYGGDYARRNY